MSSRCPALLQPASDLHPLDSDRSLWRPWLCGTPAAPRNTPCPPLRLSALSHSSSHGKSQAFQHPVRLLWPKSQSFDCLYSDGEALLKNFPVQATISFYEDSDSEEDDEEDLEENGDSEECLKQITPSLSYN